MSYWNIKTIRASKEDNLMIIKADSNRGDIFTADTMFDDRTGGVQFLTKGVVRLYNADMEYAETYDNSSRWLKPQHIDIVDKKVIMWTEEAATFYCITAPDMKEEWLGEIHDIKAGEEIKLTGLKGKRLFLADEGVSVNGTEYPQHRVIRFEKRATSKLTAEKDATVVVFYKA